MLRNLIAVVVGGFVMGVVIGIALHHHAFFPS